MVSDYPVVLKLAHRLCVVVGGGGVAERKVRALLKCKARIRVVSPGLTFNLQKWADQGMFDYQKKRYQPGDLVGAFLVISATDQRDINESVAAECLSQDILVNVVDAPDQANFYVPATIFNGPLSIAVSTGGKSPLMARLIRQDIESHYGPDFGSFIDFLGIIRKDIIENVDNPVKRQKILSQLVDARSINLIREGCLEQAKERVNNVYHSRGSKS